MMIIKIIIAIVCCKQLLSVNQHSEPCQTHAVPGSLKYAQRQIYFKFLNAGYALDIVLQLVILCSQ